MKDRRDFKRDLPSPPKRSRDNYTSALVQVEAALDEAWYVAPEEDDRELIDELKDDVREELRYLIDHMGEDNE